MFIFIMVVLFIFFLMRIDSFGNIASAFKSNAINCELCLKFTRYFTFPVIHKRPLSILNLLIVHSLPCMHFYNLFLQ